MTVFISCVTCIDNLFIYHLCGGLLDGCVFEVGLPIVSIVSNFDSINCVTYNCIKLNLENIHRI